MLVRDLFEAQARRAADAPAVIAGKERLTYGQLNERANRLAHHLRKRGVTRNSLVAVSMRRRPSLAVALLGVWKAGGAYVPLDPSYPYERLEFMLRDARVALVLTDQSSRGRVPFPEDRTVCLDTCAPIALERGDNPVPVSQASDLAYVMYTSGSTGQPKGAMIVHSGLLNYLQWALDTYRVRAGDSVPVQSSISFDLTVTSFYTPLIAGAEVELLPEEAGVEGLAEALRRRGGRALVKITPAQLDLLRFQLRPEEAAGRTRLFVIGGENLLAESLQFWRRYAPQTRLINEYGPTETVVGCCAYEVRADDPPHGAVPIGRPIAGTRLYVVNEELYIAGAGVGPGYLNRPAISGERYVPDPDAPGALMYRTGDLVRMRGDGVLEYVGRRDNQVKVDGYRIELEEVEQALAAHPDVQACAVVAPGDEASGRRLVGYVVARPGARLAARHVREFLALRLPAFMVPQRIRFLNALPLTTNGKVDRSALPLTAAEPSSIEGALHPPRSETEVMLVALWREILGLEALGIHEDVFELGARSLATMKAVTQIRGIFNVDMALRHVVEHPTVAELAEVVDALSWTGSRDVARTGGDAREELRL